MVSTALVSRTAHSLAPRRWVTFAATIAVLAAAAIPARGSAEPPAAARMTITGRLVGPDGKGVAGGRVAVIVQQYRRSEKPEGNFFGWGLALTARVLATAEADADGSFHLSGPGYSPSLPYTAAALLAGAPGHGLAFVDVDVAAPEQKISVPLTPERVVRGRLIDLQGRPAAQAKVHVVWPQPELRSFWFDRPLEGVLPFWPRTVTTDDKGRFLVRGLGRAKVTLGVHHKERLAPQQLEAETVDAGDSKEVTFSVVGTRRFQGQVTSADSHEPVPDARVLAIASPDEFGMGYQKVEGRTDRQGRFALNVFPGDYLRVIVHPPSGTPYRTLRQVIPWGQAARQETRLALPRGILVRGQVTEAGTGHPVVGARVQFRPRENNNPFYRRQSQAGSGMEEHLETAITGTDGRFQLAVLPGPGHLLVLGPTLDYVHVETSWGQLEYGKPGGLRYYPDALAALDLKSGAQAPEVALAVRRGVPFKGHVVGPDGKPVDRFLVLCRSYLPMGYEWWQRENVLEGRNGRLELPGCDPDKPCTIWLIDRSGRFGATAHLGPDAAHSAVTIRLQPCGSAVARFVTAEGKPATGYFNGKPVANYHPSFSFVVTPGACMAWFTFTGHDDKKALEADWFLWSLQPAGGKDPDVNTPGRTTFTALIPGATYRLQLPQLPRGGRQALADKGYPARDFTVKPGEVVDLGTFTVSGQ